MAFHRSTTVWILRGQRMMQVGWRWKTWKWPRFATKSEISKPLDFASEQTAGMFIRFNNAARSVPCWRTLSFAFISCPRRSCLHVWLYSLYSLFFSSINGVCMLHMPFRGVWCSACPSEPKHASHLILHAKSYMYVALHVLQLHCASCFTCCANAQVLMIDWSLFFFGGWRLLSPRVDCVKVIR